MGERDYWRLLATGVRLAVEYVTIQGRMVSFVIRLAKIQKDGKWRLVARYDTYHGWPHLDVVNGKGELVLKRWMKNMDTGEAFRWAVLDFEENHERYDYRDQKNLPQNPDAPDENGADAAVSQPPLFQDDSAGEGFAPADDGSGVSRDDGKSKESEVIGGSGTRGLRD